MMVTAAQVAIILMTATAALAKISPDAVISCSKARSQGRMYPDPEDCRKFIRCVSRKPVQFTCPPNTAFDPDTQVCAWRVGKNGCGGKLAPTTWVGMIDNLINDISQKDESIVREKASNGMVWERSKKKYDQEKSSQQSQKYMKLEKSSRDLVEEPEVTVSSKTYNAPNTQPVKSISTNAVQRKMERVAPQNTKMATTGVIGDRASSGKSKYRSYEGQTTMKTLSRDIMAKVKIESRSAFVNKTGSNTTAIANSSQIFEVSQINSTKMSGDNVTATVRNSTKTKGTPNKIADTRSSGKSVQSISAPAVRTMESVVKAEAYISNLIKRENDTSRDTASPNVTFTLPKESETPANRSDLNTTMKTNEAYLSEPQNASVIASRHNVTEAIYVIGALNASTPSTTLNTSATEALLNVTNSSIKPALVNQTEEESTNLKASVINSTAESLTTLLAQRSSKQNSFRNAMMKPTQITMYVPKSAQSKKYASSPRVDFYPVPQPYRAAVEPRSSKYSKLQEDLVSTTDATESQLENTANGTTSTGDSGTPDGTVVATSSGIDASKLAALKNILKYMTGKIVDRDSFQVKEFKPKTKRWYENNMGNGKAEEKSDYERDESQQANKTENSAENNMVEQYPADEVVSSLQRSDNKFEYAHESPVSKEQASIAPLAHVVTPSSESESKNSTTNTTTAAQEETSEDDLNLKFMSSPYMVQGLTRDFTCPKPDGHFVDPNDCTVYYHCSAGVAYRRDCSTGQVFLAEASSCVSANLAPPCIQAYANKVEMDKKFADSLCEDPNGLYKDTVSCAHYFECTNGWPIRRKCMSGTVFDEARGRCTWSKFVPGCESALSEEADKLEAGMRESFDCPRDGYFRDPKDCGVYYLCTGGEPARKACDPGTSFDANLNMCVWTYLVEGCEDRNSNLVVANDKGNNLLQSQTSEEQRMTDFTCPEENGVFPDPEDCGTYYTCIDDVAKRLQCPFGTGYDDITSLCIDSRQVPRCLNVQKTEESRASNLVQQPFTCPKHHGLYSDPYNCTRFIHCFNNTAYRHDCMPGTAFSMEKGLCTWRHLVPECNVEAAPKTTPAPSTTTTAPTAASKKESSLPSLTPTPFRSKTELPTSAGQIMRRSETKIARNALAQSDPETFVPSEPFQANHQDNSGPAAIEDFQCPSVLDGFYRDNLFCDIFHRCVLGTRFTFTCPTGTFFRMEGNLCDFWETVSDCTQDGIRLEAINSLPEVAPEPSPVPVPQPMSNDVEVDVVNLDTEPTPCPASNGLFAHPRNCKQFLFCAHHVPLVLTCPETLLYNSQTLTCDFAKNVQCVRYDHYSK